MSSGNTSCPEDTMGESPIIESSEQQDENRKQKTISSSDARYTFDAAKLRELKKQSPWKNDPKYFKKVAISPSSITKMLAHSQTGVEKGIKKGGRPIEVMGLLAGRPDPSTPHTLVVSDVYPLSVEGFETKVVADDIDVMNEMINTAEYMEGTRHERIMGWYHSHPFDLGPHSHCFLSGTDHQTQLQWQRSEDPNGNPWLAIVVDPLRSLAKKNPEIKAFRAYPPDYSAPQNECPDGTIVTEEKLRLEVWGKCWDRYYELEVEYYMSNAARNMITLLTQNYAWMTVLGSTPMLQPEVKQEFPVKIANAATKMKGIEATIDDPSSLTGGGTSEAPSSQRKDARFSQSSGSSNVEKRSKNEVEHAKTSQTIVDIATDQLLGNISQSVKKNIFC